MPFATPAPAKTIALVTGASSGIGREFARQIDLLQQVDELWLVARGEEGLRQVAAGLTTAARVLAADLASEEGLDVVRAALAKEQPRVRYLVNAAGFGKFGDWRTISNADASAMVDLNCRAVVAVTRAALPRMERGSRIVQVASAAAFAPLPHLNVYAASKAFVLRYTRALRWELHGTGIVATALCPTWVDTGFEAVARRPRREPPDWRPAGAHRGVAGAVRQPGASGRGVREPAGGAAAPGGEGGAQLRDHGRLGAAAPGLGA